MLAFALVVMIATLAGGLASGRKLYNEAWYEDKLVEGLRIAGIETQNRGGHRLVVVATLMPPFAAIVYASIFVATHLARHS